MKAIRNTLTGIVAGAALSVGALGLVGSPAAADQPVEFSDSVTFTDINPCTGTPHEVTINVDIKLHQHQNNEVVHISKTGSTDSGYLMDNGVQSQVSNGNVFRVAFTDNWRSDDGSKFQARGVFVAQESGVLVDNFALRCVGR